MHSVPRVTHETAEGRFKELFENHFEAVLRYAMARVDQETAKDAVADTLLVAWRRLADVPEPPRAWLLGVTRRTLAGQRRSRRRQIRLVERLATMPSGAPRPSAAEDVVSERAVMTGAFGRLRASDREVLCLIAWDGLSHDEAAQVLGCSPQAFKVRLHRARERLEKALAREEGSDTPSLQATEFERAGDADDSSKERT
jgi:RNA polymerase sigma-70 factor (ECF subfamily)